MNIEEKKGKKKMKHFKKNAAMSISLLTMLGIVAISASMGNRSIEEVSAEGEPNTYELVTDASQLVVGDTYAIAYNASTSSSETVTSLSRWPRSRASMAVSGKESPFNLMALSPILATMKTKGSGASSSEKASRKVAIPSMIRPNPLPQTQPTVMTKPDISMPERRAPTMITAS